MIVENILDEIRIGVKVLSNSDISGSLRNIFRYSLEILRRGGRGPIRCGGPPAYQIETNSEYRGVDLGSQTVGDKLHSREGNSPDRRLRPRNMPK